MGVGFALRGISKIVYFQLVDSQMHFPVIWISQSLKCSPTMMKYKGLTANSTKILDRDKPLREYVRFERIYFWGKTWRTGVVIDNVFVYHFVDINLGIEILFEKDEAPDQYGVDF